MRGRRPRALDSIALFSALGDRPLVFTNLKTGRGVDQVISLIEHQGLMK